MPDHTVHKNKIYHFISLIGRSLRGEEHDYTKGSIRIAIILLAIPMILELSLESVFAVVDMFFVGKLGPAAIATVGLTELAITIIYSVAIGLSTAATAVVARRIGEKNPDAAAHAGMQSLLIALLVTAITSTCGIVFAPEILKIMGAQPEVIKEGVEFTRIMLGGSLVIILLFLINGIFRGAGDPSIAMRSLWVASALNIILCPTLINGYGPFPELGLKGAAIATTIGRGIGVLYQCYYLFKGKGIIKIKPRHFKWDTPVLKTLVEVAWPATLQFIIQSGSWKPSRSRPRRCGAVFRHRRVCPLWGVHLAGSSGFEQRCRTRFLWIGRRRDGGQPGRSVAGSRRRGSQLLEFEPSAKAAFARGEA